MDSGDRCKTIEDVRAEATACCRCGLCYLRTHLVFGAGPPDARVMMVGEGPGEEEDRLAQPFVGRAGKYLDKLLEQVGLHRKDTWLTNVVRCRPCSKQNGVLRNRAPRADEIRACDTWMTAECRLIDPEVILISYGEWRRSGPLETYGSGLCESRKEAR